LETESMPSGVLTPSEPMTGDVTANDMNDWGRAVSGIFFDFASHSQGAWPARSNPPDMHGMEDSQNSAGFLAQGSPRESDDLDVACASVRLEVTLRLCTALRGQPRECKQSGGLGNCFSRRLSPTARLESSVGSTEEGNLSSSLASTPGHRDFGSEHVSGQRSTTLFNEERIASRRHHSDTMQPVGVHGLASAINLYTRSGSGLSEQSMTPTEACRQEALQRALATLNRPKSKSRLLLRERHDIPSTGSPGADDIRQADACTPSFERPCHVQRRSSAWSEKLSDTASVSSISTRLTGHAFCSESSFPQPPIPSGSLRDGRRSRPSHPALRGGVGGEQVLERSATCSGLSESRYALDSTVPCG